MMIHQKMLFWPHQFLKRVSRSIVNINTNMYKLMNTMVIIMSENKFAAGLAAPQIGNNVNIIILSFKTQICFTNQTYIDEIIIFINPKIIKSSGYIVWNEECLSIPGESGFVKRQKYVLISYLNISSKLLTVAVSNFMSVCIQHEIDHLKGILWIDYQTQLKRVVVKKKMLEIKHSANFL